MINFPKVIQAVYSGSRAHVNSGLCKAHGSALGPWIQTGGVREADLSGRMNICTRDTCCHTHTELCSLKTGF